MVLRVLGLAAVVALTACDVGEPPSPPPTITVMGDSNQTTASADIETYEVAEGTAPDDGDPCALAAALPDTDMCSLVCFPDQLAARMLDGGMKAHACYHLVCALTADVTVNVGVCLP